MRHSSRHLGTALAAAVLPAVLVLAACSPAAVDPTSPPTAPPPTEAPPPAPSPTTPPSPSASPTERPRVPVADALQRAAWVHLFDGSLTTRDGIRQVVEDLVAAEATAVIAEVVRRQDAYYRSDVLPRTTDPAVDPDLDVLQVMLDEAHAAGLEVHAWVPVATTWHPVYADLPVPAGWVTAEHGREAPEADRWVTRTLDGTWDEYLDPGLPEVRAHAAAIVGEIAARYEVDGIHLDYVRYASDRHGYHPRALERFRAETGATGTPDPADPAWSDWRRQQVDELVRGARDAVAASGRPVVLSAAVITWGDGPGGPTAPSFADTRAYREALQDWPGWAADGLVDVLVPMNYVREAEPDQASWLRTWLAFQQGLAEQTGTRVVPGIAGYLNSPADALTQIALATEISGAAAMYSYQQSTADPADPLWDELAATDWGAG